MRKDDRMALDDGEPWASDSSREAGSWESRLLSMRPPEPYALLCIVVLLRLVSPPSEKQLRKSAPHSSSGTEI